MKKIFFAISIIFSLFSIQINRVFAQPTGLALSDSLFNELENAGFDSVEKIPISSAAFEDFPYNIEVKFTPKNISSSNTFLVAFTQEDAFLHKDLVGELLNFAKGGVFNFDIVFVFTAGDNRKISGNSKTMGTKIFCHSLEGAQNMHALLLDFKATKKAYITPGAANEVSPLYLTRPLCMRLDENSVDYKISGGIYLSLYKLGILRSDERIEAFLSQGIPSVMFSMLSEQSDYTAETNAIKDFFSLVSLPESGNWSRHYIPLNLFGKHIWITEKHILMLIMAFSAICLLILSDFMFLFRKRSRRLVEVKARAIKSNYLILVTAIVLTLSLFAGQMIVGVLQKAGARNLVLLFIVKISIPFFVVSLAYPLEIKINNNMPPYIYEYILTISALLNIFIFTMLDISLFFLFALEYLILALSRTVKRTAFLYMFMLAFLLPFIPLLYSILVYSDIPHIFKLIVCNFRGNVLLSFALVPLCLLWLRVFARLNVKTDSAKKTAALYSIAALTSLVGIALISTLTIFTLNKTFFKTVELPKYFMRIEAAQKNSLANVIIYDTEYYGGKIRRIEISSTHQPERYSIFVEGQTVNPVYFSVYETVSENGRTEFLLPENPPKNLTVIYTPDSSEKATITVQAYFIEENSRTAKKETFVFDASDQEILERVK